VLDELAPAYDKFKFVRQRMGPATVNAVPHSHFLCGDDRWVAIACTNDKIFARLTQAMERPDLAVRFALIADREKDRAEVDALVNEWTGKSPRTAILEVCAANQVPCGPVYSIDEIFHDAHFAAREDMTRMIDARVGDLMVPSPVPKLKATPAKIKWLGPSLGQHTKEVYGGILGLTDEELAALRKRGVI
jgi:crotonobetainyl-CoA:carnitine CoA-transferase CaiB-like acyl-CoA transferase